MNSYALIDRTVTLSPTASTRTPTRTLWMTGACSLFIRDPGRCPLGTVLRGIHS